jgi:hypothetical protein
MLSVCAFILFFFTLVGALESVLSPLDIPKPVWSLVFGIFEMIGGMTAAAKCGAAGYVIAAFIAGWSGLSVCFQIMSVCEADWISFKPFMLSRLALALINSFTVFLLTPLFAT